MSSDTAFYRICCTFVLTIAAWSGMHAQDYRPQLAETGKYGFADESNNTVIQATFDEIHFEFYKGVACVRNGNKYSFINTAGKTLSKGFDDVQYFDANDLCIVSQNNKLGIVDITGKLCLDTKYSYIGDFNENGFAVINIGGTEDEEGVVSGGKFGFIDKTGSVCVQPKYSFIGPRSEVGLRWVNIGGAPDKDGVCSGGKFGFIDDGLNEVIPPVYTFVGDFDSDGICWVCIGGKVFSGDKNVEAQIGSFSRGEKDPVKIAAKREELENAITGGKVDVCGHKIFEGKYGFMDSAGNKITDIVYNKSANSFSDGIAWVALKNKYGYIDISGNQIVPFVYDEVAPRFCEGIAWAKKTTKNDSKYGYVDKNGDEVTDFIYSKVNDVKDGFAIVAVPAIIEKGKIIRSSQYGLINGSGKRITETKYDGISKMAEGMALCKLNNRFCYINSDGREITPFVINDGTVFRDGIAVVKVNPEDAESCRRGNSLNPPAGTKRNPKGIYGIIDKQGTALTDFVYSHISKPSCGRIAVKRDDEFAFIDLSGDEIFSEKFENVHDFEQGYAAVCKDSKWGWIDSDGQTVIERKYDDAGAVVDGLLCVKLNDKWGAVSVDDKVVIPFNLATANDAKDIINEVYIPGGRIPLSVRQTAIFNANRKNKETKFSISDIIPSDYWDY